MHNKDLASDYIERAGHRLAALEVLWERKSFADVVREAQELIELCLKAILRMGGVEPPRSHDLSDILLNSANRLAPEIRPQVKTLANISRKLRRDRELSFYGSEDLTPSDFYKLEDAEEAFENAKWIYGMAHSLLK